MADDYIQFIRELSIECRKNGIVLSVDTYVMQAYNEFYNREGIAEAADYLIIMGYDEHWAGDSSAGSVAIYCIFYIDSFRSKSLLGFCPYSRVKWDSVNSSIGIRTF